MRANVINIDYKVKTQCMSTPSDLAFEENGMGRFLKDFGKLDKTRTGKIMIASGKAMSYSSQQRLALRPSIVRLAEEVDTFRYRAIEDTALTVSSMEKVRKKSQDFCVRMFVCNVCTVPLKKIGRAHV